MSFIDFNLKDKTVLEQRTKWYGKKKRIDRIKEKPNRTF